MLIRYNKTKAELINDSKEAIIVELRLIDEMVEKLIVVGDLAAIHIVNNRWGAITRIMPNSIVFDKCRISILSVIIATIKDRLEELRGVSSFYRCLSDIENEDSVFNLLTETEGQSFAKLDALIAEFEAKCK